jgi:uncharacterized membrane protein
MLLWLGGKEVPVVGGEVMPVMVAAADTLMVAAMEDEVLVADVVVADVVVGEVLGKEAVPLDVQTTPRQKCLICLNLLGSTFQFLVWNGILLHSVMQLSTRMTRGTGIN